MELEKRKRGIIREGREEERDRLKKLKEDECGAGGSGGGGEGAVVPTEDEVEEFYAILRRMKQAVKYFDEKGKGGKEWREALEQTEDAVDVGDDGGVGVVEKNEKDAINEGFDLNAAAPETAEGGGA